MRFGMRRLMIVVAGVCVLCSLYVAARHAYYSERRDNMAALTSLKGVSIESIHSHIDVVEEVGSTSISVKAHPGSSIVTGNLQNYLATGRFNVRRIGKWCFSVNGNRHCGAYKIATGEPVESDYFGSSIQLGPGGPYEEIIPVPTASLQDVVDHYQELVEFFESWPRKNAPGEVTLEDGSIQYYYVREDPASSE